MWRSPEHEPLDVSEQQAAFTAQRWFRMVKACTNCGQTRPVGDFGGYGFPVCSACMASGPFNPCSCGNFKLSCLPRCRDCHMKLLGFRQAVA